VSALLELRKLFGDPLAGTALEEKDCEECDFADAVARVAEQPVPIQLPPPAHCEEDIYQSAPQAVFNWMPPQVFIDPYMPAIQPPPAIAITPPEGQRVFIYSNASVGDPHTRMLRQSARQLESVANDLEDIGLYEKADELRKSAGGLRELARGESQAQARIQVHGVEFEHQPR